MREAPPDEVAEMTELCAAVCDTMSEHRASYDLGMAALTQVLIVAMKSRDMSKREAIKLFSKAWELVEFRKRFDA